MIIKYYIKEHFGVARMYVADEVQAKAFQKLTQRKIILPEHIEAFKTLGITFEDINETKQ